MSTITQIVEQTSIVDNYSPDVGESCVDGDWEYGTEQVTDGVQARCSKIAPKETCGEIGRNQTAEWKINNDGKSASPLVECTYDVNTFTFEDVNEYKSMYGEDSGFNNVVMPSFCFEESKICVNNPRTSKPWAECPNMLNSGAEGLSCRNWRSENKEIADEAQDEYCDENPGSSTCDCYTRDQNDVYQIVSEDNPYNAGCWFYPCVHPAGYLVPSDLINDDPTCPEEKVVCSNINDTISNTVTYIPQSEFQKDITCPITAIPQTPQEPGSGSSSSSSGVIWIIFLIIFIIVIVCIIAALIYYRRKGSM